MPNHKAQQWHRCVQHCPGGDRHIVQGAHRHAVQDGDSGLHWGTELMLCRDRGTDTAKKHQRAEEKTKKL